MQTIRVIDSHTGGEPTRIIVEGGPDLGRGSMHERRAIFQQRFDRIRSAVINEPRGSDVIVGGLLCDPVSADCRAGIIFFNNTGYLNMCGHGTIGLMVTLGWLGRLQPGAHRIETPVGIVTARLFDEHRVSLQNVASWRFLKDVEVNVEGHGPVRGDVAWGGNWFFLVSQHGQELSHSRCAELTRFSQRIRDSLKAQGITGEDGSEIDHIELFGPATNPNADSRNFVLCPGGAWDRSPCGTGTSAKVACLAADGRLAAGQVWRQESMVGSIFEATYESVPDSTNGSVIPTITGRAWITADSRLILDPSDPFCDGIR